MIWLTWRQFRGQAITAAAILVVLAIALVSPGRTWPLSTPHAGLNTCHANCGSLACQL